MTFAKVAALHRNIGWNIFMGDSETEFQIGLQIGILQRLVLLNCNQFPDKTIKEPKQNLSYEYDHLDSAESEGEDEVMDSLSDANSQMEASAESIDHQAQDPMEALLPETENWDLENDVPYPPFSLSPQRVLLPEELTQPSPRAAYAMEREAKLAKKQSELAESEETSDLPEYTKVRGHPRKLYVGNINFKTRAKRLWDFFEKFGPVQYCEILKDHRHKSRGRGFVTFRTQEGVDAAMAASEEELNLDDRVLRPRPAEHRVYKSHDYKSCDKSKFRHNPPIDQGETRLCPDNAEEVVSSEPCTAHGQEKQDISSDTFDTTHEKYGTSHIHCLNQDIMFHIFHFLSVTENLQCQRVCKRWLSISKLSHRLQEELVFPNISFNPFSMGSSRPEKFRDQDLSLLLGEGWLALRSLDVSGVVRGLSPNSIRQIVKHVPNLERLNISGATFPCHDIFRKLPLPLESLTHVNMSKCQNFEENGLWWFFLKHKALTHINLDDVKRLSGKCFYMLTDKIVSLSLRECSKLSTMGMEKIAQRCTALRELYLDNCLGLKDEAMTPLTSLSTLEVLSFSGPRVQVTPAGLVLLGRLTNLRDLCLEQNAHGVSDEVIQNVASGCTKLRSLDIAGCHLQVSDEGVMTLRFLTELTTLNISYLNQISDASLVTVAETGALTTLVARGCSGITDYGVSAIGTACLNIREVDVSASQLVTNDCLDSYVANALGRDTPSDKDDDQGGKKATYTDNKITLITGGTLVDTTCLELPENLLVMDFDRSNHRLIPDRDLTIRADFGDYDFDDFDELGEDVHAYLAGDDPLFEEQWDMS